MSETKWTKRMAQEGNTPLLSLIHSLFKSVNRDSNEISGVLNYLHKHLHMVKPKGLTILIKSLG